MFYDVMINNKRVRGFLPYVCKMYREASNNGTTEVHVGHFVEAIATNGKTTKMSSGIMERLILTSLKDMGKVPKSYLVRGNISHRTGVAQMVGA